MCLLTYLPAGREPDLDALRTGAVNNPHGHGYAIVTGTRPPSASRHPRSGPSGERLVVVKGLDAEVVLERFDHDRRAHPGGPALFHSRLATHGSREEANCHPFTLGRDARTVIAHNGVLPRQVHPRRGDSRSDTRIAAEDYLPALGPMHLRRTRLQAERWMGPDNRMVLLTVDRRYRHHAYLFHEDTGLWRDGVWFSNDSFEDLPPLPSPARGPLWRRPTAWWDDVPARRSRPAWLDCAACGDVADPDQEWCPWCRHCWACGEPPQQCDCWTPAVLRPTRPRSQTP